MVVAVGAGVLRSRLRARREHAHGHTHEHAHAGVGTRSLLSMGAAAGLIPCPSALVVLLAAVSQHEVALGMLLIVAFSLGLAGTLTALGLAVVHARRFVPPRVAASRLAAVLPAVSAALVVVVGMALAAQAVPDVI
jgi:ABC-type nickel/cobalt efflux system permease component RcnA